MEQWKTFLIANTEVLGDVNIKRGIFQGDTLSLMPFIIVLIPLSMTLRKMECGYHLEKTYLKINHTFSVDDLRLFRKNER